MKIYDTPLAAKVAARNEVNALAKSRVEHTPLPWMVTTENKGAIPEHFRPYVITNQTGDQVIARLPDGRGREETANAALIVRAVNEREELIACLRDLVAADNCNYDRAVMRSEGYFDRARAVLAKVEGEG